jgi:hypothetical protein
MKTEKTVIIVLETEEECDRLRAILRIFDGQATQFFSDARGKHPYLRAGYDADQWAAMQQMAEALWGYTL